MGRGEKADSFTSLTFTFDLLSAAEADMDSAARWYELQRRGLGREFVLCVENALNRFSITRPHIRPLAINSGGRLSGDSLSSFISGSMRPCELRVHRIVNFYWSEHGGPLVLGV